MSDDDSGTGGKAGRGDEILEAMRLSSEQHAGTPPRKLSPAAERALAEAEERRRAAGTTRPDDLPKEVNGRDGPEPVRYGDWEKNGIISDF